MAWSIVVTCMGDGRSGRCWRLCCPPSLLLGLIRTAGHGVQVLKFWKVSFLFIVFWLITPMCYFSFSTSPPPSFKLNTRSSKSPPGAFYYSQIYTSPTQDTGPLSLLTSDTLFVLIPTLLPKISLTPEYHFLNSLFLLSFSDTFSDPFPLFP
jgi:hypothetical protein